MLINAGKDIQIDVDVAKLPPAAMDHVVAIGLRNILMDAHANATKKSGATVDEARALSMKKLDAMMRGEIRSISTRTTDPVEQELKRLVGAAIKKAGGIEALVKAAVTAGKATDESDAKAKIDTALRAKFATQAKANAEAANAVDVGDIL